MSAYYGQRRRRRVSTAFHRGVFRTAYFVGAAFRRAVDLVLLPVRAVAGKNPRRSGSREFRSILSRRPEITSKLSGMEERLRSLEHSLLGPERFGASEALAGLADLASPSAGEEIPTELIEAVTDPDPGVRRLALSTIRDIGSESSASLIVDALHDPDSSVRCAAAAAAAETGATAAVFSLILSLDDPALEVRRTAKLAIEKITGREIDFDPSKDSPARTKKIVALKKWWKEERFTSLAGDVDAVFRS
jgi:hypothetical protein